MERVDSTSVGNDYRSSNLQATLYTYATSLPRRIEENLFHISTDENTTTSLFNSRDHATGERKGTSNRVVTTTVIMSGHSSLGEETRLIRWPTSVTKLSQKHLLQGLIVCNPIQHLLSCGADILVVLAVEKPAKYLPYPSRHKFHANKGATRKNGILTDTEVFADVGFFSRESLGKVGDEVLFPRSEGEWLMTTYVGDIVDVAIIFGTALSKPNRFFTEAIEDVFELILVSNVMETCIKLNTMLLKSMCTSSSDVMLFENENAATATGKKSSTGKATNSTSDNDGVEVPGNFVLLEVVTRDLNTLRGIGAFIRRDELKTWRELGSLLG